MFPEKTPEESDDARFIPGFKPVLLIWVRFNSVFSAQFLLVLHINSRSGMSGLGLFCLRAGIFLTEEGDSLPGV